MGPAWLLNPRQIVRSHNERWRRPRSSATVRSVYLAYDLSRALLRPLNLWASTVQGAFSSPGVRPLPFVALVAASGELVERATRRYPKPPFGLTHTVVAGDRVAIRETVVLDTPFCRLLRFERVGVDRADPKLLVVAPLSGHHATLVRETIQEMLPDHDVYVTDWRDARLVPRAGGSFDLHDYIDLIPRLLAAIGDDVHVLAVCQPCVPVLAAVAVMENEGTRATPRSMTMISGPIDARVSPTRVNHFALDHSLAWLEATLVYRVPPPAPGFGRRVYPGALQLQAFVSLDVARHVAAHCKHFLDVAAFDEKAAEKHRSFYDEYFAVIDLPAELYLQTVAEVFQEHTLPRGIMLHRGTRVQPEAITRTALLTIEGAKDDITGLGQTAAAHTLCRSLPASKKQHHLQEGVGHYGTFSGRRWREEVAPVVKAFVRSQS